MFTLIHGPNLPGCYAVFFFTASDFTFTIRHIHKRALYPLWFELFILSGVISPLFSSNILDTSWPGGGGGVVSFSVLYFGLFILFMVFQRQECWVACLSLLKSTTFCQKSPTMTCPNWVALHCMAYRFIELHKAVINVIILVSFLWLWFPYCLPSDGWG